MLAVLFGVLAGACLPVQTSVNTRLRLSVGSPLLASLLSFTVGTVALAAATLVATGRAYPELGLAAGSPWWTFIGGMLGVFVLTGNILLFPRIGGVQTVVLPIAGQVLMGLAIDAFGIFGSAVVPLSVSRIAGGLAVLLGVLLVVNVFQSRAQSPADRKGEPALWLWRLMGGAMGLAAATQTAVNGRLGGELGSAVAAALFSFATGAATLLLLVLLTRTPFRFRVPDGQARNPAWMWIGGVLGSIIVFAGAFLAPVIGTGATVVVLLLGMMTGSVLIDTFGLLGSPRRRPQWTQVVGLVVILVGVVLIRIV